MTTRTGPVRAPEPPAGQEHLPWLTPRPDADATTLEVVRDRDGRYHAPFTAFGCSGWRRTEGSLGSRRSVRVSLREAAEETCPWCAGLLTEVVAALDDPDRRVALTFAPSGPRSHLATGFTRGSADFSLLVTTLFGAAPSAPVPDTDLVLAALPLPVVKLLRDVAYLPLERIRTVEAHLVATIAALWAGDDTKGALGKAVRTAARLSTLDRPG